MTKLLDLEIWVDPDLVRTPPVDISEDSIK